jgi:hypothetical protein
MLTLLLNHGAQFIGHGCIECRADAHNGLLRCIQRMIKFRALHDHERGYLLAWGSLKVGADVGPHIPAVLPRCACDRPVGGHLSSPHGGAERHGDDVMFPTRSGLVPSGGQTIYAVVRFDCSIDERREEGFAYDMRLFPRPSQLENRRKSVDFVSIVRSSN